MIDPKELMLHNIVMCNDNEVVITELRSSKCEIALPPPSTFVMDVSYRFIQPTPLTPEILERCGFVKYDDCNYWIGISNFNLQKLIVSFIGDEITISFSDEYSTKQVTYPLMGVKDPHLHTLQNLAAILGHTLELTPQK